MANTTSEPEVTYVHYLETHPIETSFLIVIMLIIITIGTVGNIFIIGAVAVTKSLRTTANYFVINLAICDVILAGPVNIFFVVAIFTGERWFVIRKEFCGVLAFVCLSACLASLACVAFIAINRYVCICRSSVYPTIFSKRNTIIINIIIWVYSMWLNFAVLGGWGRYTYDRKMIGCVWDRMEHRAFSLSFLAGVFIPLVTVAICNALIFWKVYQTKKKIASVGKGGDKKMDKEIKLAKVLFLVFLIFLVMNSPFVAVILFDSADVLPVVVYVIVVQLMHGNASGVNCFVYGISNRAFREGYKNFYYKIFGVCGVKRPIGKSANGNNSSTNGSTVVTKVET
ncbi:unnamed protein product [Owenia fusiformis]|uniref:Uncharacterized protein n=1 Tax=Owenia fusiformis TaxID=6347 RepID=A0A8J1TGD3_OWEFU|nr:unnamed protein product [Owenia fusiformis]